MRGRVTGFLMITLTLAGGCDDSDPSADLEEPEFDAAMVEPDVAVTPDPDAGGGNDPDVFTPPPHLAAPQVNIFPSDPLTDEWMTSVVETTETTSEDGALTSNWVQVFNCLNEDGGFIAMPMGLPVTIQMCNEVQSARPGPDGHYTHIVPPFQDTNPNDEFAEVQMYHHVNVVHDYFKNNHGFAELDYPLQALVNVQLKVDPPAIAGLIGFEADEDGWVGLPNAAFFPQESWDQFAGQFGLPPREGDLIVFGQAGADFSYDARVIYHEYTHAVVGTERLQAQAVPDAWGLDNSSGSMNEGLADYFAATISDAPEIGLYGIGALAPGQVRNVAEPRRCPDDLADEVHAQGRIVGSTTWAVREAVGAEIADQIVFNALEQFTIATTHDGAAELMLAEAEELGVEDEVRAIFEDFGFGNCARTTEWVDWSGAASRDRLPRVVEGHGSGGLAGFTGGVPGYQQFWFDVPDGTAGVELTWQIAGGGGAVGGLGGSPRPVKLAARYREPIRFSYIGSVQMHHDYVVDPPLENGGQTVTLTGECLTIEGGRLHTIFINSNDSAMNITSMGIELLDDVEGATNVFDCAGGEEEE